MYDDETYSEQGYDGYYSQNTYDSSVEAAEDYLLDSDYPVDGDTIYDYCNDIAEPSLLNNNQIKYTANEQLTIQSGVDYTDHTFDNGVGVVTFTNDLTTLEPLWFEQTFDNYIDNITSLTLPNGVSSIEMAALPGIGVTYYEGTQKECARIKKDLYDGTGAGTFICFDGIVDDMYVSNIINPLLLWYADWLKKLIGGETLNNLLYKIVRFEISTQPMTAGEFITMLVNGTQDVSGLSTYGFTVIIQEKEGVTIPLAYHTESGHFMGIVKANDYAHVNLEHIVTVTVNEALDSDYMYALLDDTAINPEPTTEVEVTIEREDGTSETVTLDANQTYAEQGYDGYYSSDTYDSSVEIPEQFLVDNDYPVDGATIYDYCDDTAEDEPEDPDEPEESWEDIINDESYVFDAGTIAAGQTKPVTIDGNVARFTFTPENDGIYNIYSTGEEDTVGAIFDSEDMITSDDDSAGAGNNFMLNIDLTGGETYYIHTTLYHYESSGSFDLVVDEM